MDEDKVPEEIRQLYHRMHDEMVPLVQRHTISIIAYYNGEPRQHATGTLVQFSDYFFIVTAAHAIRDFAKAKCLYPDIRLYIDNGDGGMPIPLDGTYLAISSARDPKSPNYHFQEDILDVGIWEIDRFTVDALTKKSFLNRTSISITEDLTRGVYFLAGFPCVWATKDAANQAMNFRILRYIAHPCDETGSLPNFDKQYHMALWLKQDSPMPNDFRGISGCSIWKLTDFPNDKWKVDDARIVAVQTCVYPDSGILRGTKWEYVIHVIVHKHSDIRDIFKLWLPGKE